MKHGFSLVELSIVLVILGLLTGGILAGQSLIRASELRSISSDYQKYVAATQTFRDKYFALPGDMTNAQSFWGVAHATPATCVTTASTSALTCNGNGNGSVDISTGSNEYFRFWQHLANAGLVEGTYNGIASAGSGQAVTIGTNVPRSKISNTGFFLRWLGVYGGDGGTFSADYGHVFYYGTGAAPDATNQPALSPEEVWNIDVKLDDGKPAFGKVITVWWDNCTPATSRTDVNVDYLLSNSATQCAIYFARAF